MLLIRKIYIYKISLDVKIETRIHAILIDILIKVAPKSCVGT